MLSNNYFTDLCWFHWKCYPYHIIFILQFHAHSNLTAKLTYEFSVTHRNSKIIFYDSIAISPIINDLGWNDI
jgi:hypothetical protein